MFCHLSKWWVWYNIHYSDPVFVNRFNILFVNAAGIYFFWSDTRFLFYVVRICVLVALWMCCKVFISGINAIIWNHFPMHSRVLKYVGKPIERVKHWIIVIFLFILLFIFIISPWCVLHACCTLSLTTSSCLFIPSSKVVLSKS